MHKLSFIRTVFLAAALAFLPQLSFAQELATSATGDWASAPDGQVKLRLISGVEAVGDTGSLPLGLEIELAPHWKTYWRSPGTAGLPITLDWTGSDNLAQATISWPAPTRFEYAGIESFGYTDHVILPIAVNPAKVGTALALKARVDMMACAELCIPFSFNLALNLPAGMAAPSSFAADIASWQGRVPQATHPQLSIDRVESQGSSYRVTVTANPPLSKPELIVESPSGYVYGAPELTAGSPAILTVKPSGAVEPEKPDSELTLTLIDGARTLEKTMPVSPAGTLPASTPHNTTLLSALLAAFIGGLILNLMPCVLPVLSLKLLTIISHGNSPPRHVRLSFLASAAGILTSFLALAAIAISLKQAGVAVGWGVQFQHPAFIFAMTVLLTLFAASLWDILHIPLPRFMADAINDRLPAPGEHDRTLLGNFVTGAFATILATPCSAPFVGTALGFAFSGTSADIALTALVMGLGLALPYLLVAAFPRIARFLPRPGKWMNGLKALMGIALLFSAIWMASTGRQQLSPDMATYLMGTPIFLLMLMWFRASFAKPRLFIKGVVWGIIVLVAGTFAEGYLRQPAPAHINWQAFEQARIPTLVAEGKTVFVDVTADWCLTCQVNKRFVLSTEPTVTRLNAAHVVAMKADWSKPSPVIASYLQSFGRYGIPFNVVYGPGAPQGIALPELLTTEAVKNALDRAGAAPGSCSNC